MDWKSLIGHRLFKLISAGTFTVSLFMVQPYRPVIVMGKSMFPTYDDREFAMATTDTSQLKVGDVVVIGGPEENYVKRVAYLPGDWIDYYHYGNEWVAGESIGIKGIRRSNRLPHRRLRVPHDRIYVLGDNASVSEDSRDWGTIPLSEIKAKLVSPKPKRELQLPAEMH